MFRNGPICPVCSINGQSVRLRKKDNITYCRKCGFTNRHYDQTLGGYIRRISDTSLENIKKLREFEPEKIPNYRLQRLYYESYSLALIGKYHASMIFQGLLMENLVKEIIFMNDNEYNSNEFAPNLKYARDKGYLTDEEFQILDKIRRDLRNPYAHSDIHRMTKGLETQIFWVETPVTGKQSAPQMDEAMRSILAGKAVEGKIDNDSGEARQFIMDLIDEKICIPTLNEAYDFLVEMCKKYFNDQAYEEHRKKFGPHIKWKSTEKKRAHEQS